MSKILYSTVIYECDDFDIFINDYLKSVFNQTEQNFELLVIIDNANKKKVEYYINKYNTINKIIYIKEFNKFFSPIQLRKELINFAYSIDATVLIFSDFDENVASNRVEEIRSKINNFDFTFNDFYIVDYNLKKLDENTFFHGRNIPNIIIDWHDIKLYNYIGLGSMAINLLSYDYKSMEFPSSIRALDWFIATKVLLDGGTGIKLDNTYANYRQHKDSFVGFDFRLNKKKLKQGLEIKKNHYDYFKKYNFEYKTLYKDIVELNDYIDKIGEDKYINIVNAKFDTTSFCWWENIKIEKELL